MTGRWWAIAIGVLLLAVATTAFTWQRTRDGALAGPGAVDTRTASADFHYVVPAGTGQRLDRGETVELMPAVLNARVGQTIRIVNHDDRDYVLGPFIVSANATLTQRFTSAGRFQGVCAVHPSGQITVTVRG